MGRLGNKYAFKHGWCFTSEYAAWREMRYRCRNPKCHAYPCYGGRGIKVCDRWHLFVNFIADMGKKPGPEYSIHRIDGNGNYEPSNCKWATTSEQMQERFSRITHCPKGHPYSGKNLYISKKGSRTCIICKRTATQNWRKFGPGYSKRASRS